MPGIDVAQFLACLPLKADWRQRGEATTHYCRGCEWDRNFLQSLQSVAR